MTAQQPVSGQHHEPELDDAHGLDPTDLLRALLAISPEDAASVREDAAEAMKPSGRSER